MNERSPLLGGSSRTSTYNNNHNNHNNTHFRDSHVIDINEQQQYDSKYDEEEREFYYSDQEEREAASETDEIRSTLSEKFTRFFSFSSTASQSNRNNNNNPPLLPVAVFIPTFYCEICLENVAKTDKYNLTCCSSNHEYCIGCLESWCSTQIVDGVIAVPCPGFSVCKSVLSQEDIQTIVHEDILKKFLRFKTMKEHQDYRECPHCSQQHELEEPPTNPIIQCSKCKLEFCFFHSNAHPGLSCSEYNQQLGQRIQQEMKASDSLVKKLAKLCPSCKAATEKNGGCNHMTCQSCRCNWCWLCNREMVDVTEHYSTSNLFGCPGAQFIPEDPVTTQVQFYVTSPFWVRVVTAFIRFGRCIFGLISTLLIIACFSIFLLSILIGFILLFEITDDYLVNTAPPWVVDAFQWSVFFCLIMCCS